MQDYDPEKIIASRKKDKYMIPKTRREANHETIKTNAPGPQSYNLLDGKGLVDTKNRTL